MSHWRSISLAFPGDRRVARIWPMTRDMRGHRAIRRISMRLAPVLAPLLGVSASTSALPSDFSDFDAPSFIEEPPSRRPVLDSPAMLAPAVDPAVLSQSSTRWGAKSGNPLWAIPLATLSETRERPIFSPSRRPPPAVVSVAAPKAPPVPQMPQGPPVELRLVLVGTVIGGDRSFGIFVDQMSKTTLRLKVDEDYQGWRLRSVHRSEVTMARGELTETLKFRKPGEGAPVAGPAVAESAVRRGSSHTPEYD